MKSNYVCMRPPPVRMKAPVNMKDITWSHGVHIIINPRCACAARVTVVVLCVCMCVCVYVCMCVCVCVHSYLPPHTLESQKRDTNGFCAIQGSF